MLHMKPPWINMVLLYYIWLKQGCTNKYHKLVMHWIECDHVHGRDYGRVETCHYGHVETNHYGHVETCHYIAVVEVKRSLIYLFLRGCGRGRGRGRGVWVWGVLPTIACYEPTPK